MANLYVEGPTAIGEDNVFFPYSTVGVASQDKKYKGERAFTRIGSRNTIREFVTIHRGTQGGGLLTEIGDGNLLMAYTHVAHDVKIGSGAMLDNGVTLAGHVTVGDNATISAFSGVHQFCRVGRECFHRRIQRGHAGCDAVFERRQRARDPGVRREPGRP